MHLLSTVERYLRRNKVPATRFGRDALRDPRFVQDLRRGREPGARIVAKVLDYMRSQGGGACR